MSTELCLLGDIKSGVLSDACNRLPSTTEGGAMTKEGLGVAKGYTRRPVNVPAVPPDDPRVEPEQAPTLILSAANELRRNYSTLRRQTQIGALFSIFAMTCGLGLLVTGSVLVFTGSPMGTSVVVALSGLMTEFLSGIVFYFYRLHFNELQEVSKRQVSSWEAFTSYALASGLPEHEKSELRRKAVLTFLGRGAELTPDQTRALVSLYQACLTFECIHYFCRLVNELASGGKAPTENDVLERVMGIRNRHRREFVCFQTPLGDLNTYLNEQYDKKGWWEAQAPRIVSIIADSTLAPEQKHRRIEDFVRNAADTTLLEYFRAIDNARH
jgi:hypothetical protein